MPRKQSFFERLKGSMRMDDAQLEDDVYNVPDDFEDLDHTLHDTDDFEDQEDMDGELTVDVFHNDGALVVKAMTSGVKKDDLDISITREQVIIRGLREVEEHVDDSAYYFQELYWGTFSRVIDLPEEIDVDLASAKEEHGLLTVTLPLVDKDREAKLKVE